jgi:hypothetical protein
MGQFRHRMYHHRQDDIKYQDDKKTQGATRRRLGATHSLARSAIVSKGETFTRRGSTYKRKNKRYLSFTLHRLHSKRRQSYIQADKEIGRETKRDGTTRQPRGKTRGENDPKINNTTQFNTRQKRPNLRPKDQKTKRPNDPKSKRTKDQTTRRRIT